MIKGTDGSIYKSLREWANMTNHARRAGVMDAMKTGGYTIKGITYTHQDGGVIVAKSDKLLDKLKERYSDKELDMLCKGEGLVDKSRKPEHLRLHGKHHRICVISDGHLGSKYTPDEWHEEVFREAEKQDCECILHCGDLVEGLTPRRIATQIYELDYIGYRAQKEHAIEVYSKCKLPIHVISGNHDAYYNEYAGANIVEDICDNVQNMHYLGHDCADIDIDGVKIRLFHGSDGSSYALSYRLQKLIESFTGGDKPNVLFAGHVHKFCYLFDRHIHAVSVPCLQRQTGFMKSKKLAAHTGFVIVDFDAIDGQIANFNVKLYPFYK